MRRPGGVGSAVPTMVPEHRVIHSLLHPFSQCLRALTSCQVLGQLLARHSLAFKELSGGSRKQNPFMVEQVPQGAVGMEEGSKGSPVGAQGGSADDLCLVTTFWRLCLE